MTGELRHQQKEADQAQLIREGSERAWRDFYDEIYSRLLFFTCQIANDRQGAHTIVSEAFLSLWKLKDNLQTLEDMRALLYVICRRRAYNFSEASITKKKREILADDVQVYIKELTHDDDLMNDVNRAEIFYEMHEAIKNLPHRQQEVIKLLLNNKTSPEIGAALDISASTVRSIREQAIGNIKKHLLEKHLLTALAIELLAEIFTLHN